MTVELGIALAIGTAIASAAATWGAFRTRLAVLADQGAQTREAIAELRASAIRQGERIGELDRRIAIDRAVRRATGAHRQEPEEET